MTELDRLRAVAEDLSGSEWGEGLVAALLEIANAIERETRDLSGYESDVLGLVEKNGGLDAVKERLMPEDMSWPFYEDGEPVRIGDEVEVHPGCSFEVDNIAFEYGGFILNAVHYRDGERIKRPAKVLDADGVEIHVWDTVWHTKTGAEYRVLSLPDLDKGAWVTTKTNTADRLFLDLAVLTHRAPVFAADGKPIREGETVYLLPGDWCDVFPCLGYHGGEELEVFSLHADHVEGGVGCRDTQRALGATCYPQPSQLTHERPEIDSWERWVEDTDKSPCEYFGVTGSGCDGCRRDPYMCDHERNEDLVRRAKKLPKGCE